jgi:two-component sensor histidine kinase
VQRPLHKGFGSRLIMIEQAAMQQLNGRADLRFQSEGVTCRLDMPLENDFAAYEKAPELPPRRLAGV